jgi:shikimate kinase
MHNIYIGGPNGVGKTTVGLLVGSALPSGRFLDGSDVFAEATGVDPSSEEASLAIHRQRNDAFLEEILRGPDRVVLAGHFHLSRELLSWFDCACIFLVTQEVLLNRRLHDTTRKRSLDPAEVLRECDVLYGRFCGLIGSSGLPCFAIPAMDDPRTIAACVIGVATMMARLNDDR